MVLDMLQQIEEKIFYVSLHNNSVNYINFDYHVKSSCKNILNTIKYIISTTIPIMYQCINYSCY